jgi:polysaccharide chain length determinant protein (PEP-CTERM system associated)
MAPGVTQYGEIDEMEELVSQLLSLAKGIWKYRWYAVVVAWVTVFAGWIVVYKLHDNYQASARVFVDTQSILKPLLSGMTSVPNVEQQVSIMSRTLLSRPNVEKVMRMVDLDLKAKTVKDHEELVNNLLAKIKIGGTIQNDIYTISFSDENSKLAKDVVQALLTIFVEGSFGDKKDDSEKAIHFIDEKIKSYEEKLGSAENALKQFKVKNMGLLPRAGGDYGTKLLETSDALSQARLELREAEQARNAIKKQIDGDGAPVKGERSASSISNPEIDGRIQALSKNLDALRMQYTEEHPDIVSIKRLLAQLEARKVEESKLKKAGADPGMDYSPMLQQLTVSLSAADARVAAMRARVDEYAVRVEHIKTMSLAAPEVETELSQLNRDYQVNKENYEKLLASRESAKLSGDLTANTEMMTFKVVDPPTVPLTPSSPNRPLLVSGVFVGSLLLGIGFALLLSKLRPTFMTQAELREVTGLPILGAVTKNWTPLEKSRQKRSLYIFGASFLVLLTIYAAIMARILIKLYT